jgi:hypothetical protein
MGRKSVSIEIKWQVIGMHKTNLSNRVIGRTTLANYNATGNVAEKPRPGGPKKTSQRGDVYNKM